MNSIKWWLFRIIVAYYFYKTMRNHGYGLSWSWNYSDSFDNFFDCAEWSTIREDAEEAVYEELSCWD